MDMSYEEQEKYGTLRDIIALCGIGASLAGLGVACMAEPTPFFNDVSWIFLSAGLASSFSAYTISHFVRESSRSR